MVVDSPNTKILQVFSIFYLFEELAVPGRGHGRIGEIFPGGIRDLGPGIALITGILDEQARSRIHNERSSVPFPVRIEPGKVAGERSP